MYLYFHYIGVLESIPQFEHLPYYNNLFFNEILNIILYVVYWVDCQRTGANEY